MFLTMNLITLEDHNARRRIKVATLGRFRSSFVNIDTLVSGEAASCRSALLAGCGEQVSLLSHSDYGVVVVAIVLAPLRE